MKSLRYIVSIIVLSFFAAAGFTSCKTPKLAKAEEKQRIGEYYEAASMYRKIYAKISPKDREQRGLVAFNMAECYRMINNASRAIGAYTNAGRYQFPDSSIYLRLAQMQQQQGQYAQAIGNYRKYLEEVPGSIIALNGIKGCEMAPIWKQNPTIYTVKRVEKINSRYGDFSPMLYGSASDQLYFASSRYKGKDNVKKNPITGMANNQIYLSKKDEKGNWTEPEAVTGDVPSDNFDQGTPSFSPDGGQMYYTYCAQADDGARPAEIYVAARSSAKWGQGSRISLVKDSITSIAHPAVSPDGEFLYFISDISGGFGGKDIYRARITGADFGGMENLGPVINTPGDEMFPYVKDSVTIFFASDGHPGMGGLDIFKASMDSLGHWTVENMQSPVNSSSDDFGITFASNGLQGFFSSNRNDTRGFDHIYSFEEPTFTVLIEGLVSDVDNNPIEDATIRIVGRDGLNEKATARRDGSYRIELKRDVSYVMMASARGFLNQNFELKTTDKEINETYTVDFFLSPVYQPVVIENIFYDFDRASLRPESKTALDGMVKMLNDNPNVTIELGAHTDRKGTDEYNENLAQRRAKSVVDYLIQTGIAADRLEAKGYGESQPKTISKKMAEEHPFLHEGDVLTDDFIQKLTPEQQEIADQINRRTEFKVLRTNYNLY
jgi:peptidoglycan-associated lipoprotein